MPQVDSKHMEMLMINKVISRLEKGDLEKLCDTRQRYRTSLEQAIQATRAEHGNLYAASTIRAWVDHYILWGETPTETRKREVKMRQRCKQSKWTPQVNSLLRDIIWETRFNNSFDYHQNIYLAHLQYITI